MGVGHINHFLAQINNDGVAKNSHWDARISIPLSLVGTEFAAMDRIMAFRCEAGELPGRQLVTSDIKVYGPIYRTPYQSLYTELNLTFIETQDMKVRRFMESWMNTIFDSRTNILSYQNTYRTEITLTQYDVVPSNETNTSTDRELDLQRNTFREFPAGLNPVMTIHCHDCYPTNINQMSTAWSDDSPHRVQVSFFYEWYTLSPVSRPVEGRSEFVSESPAGVNSPTAGYDVQIPWLTNLPGPFRNR